MPEIKKESEAVQDLRFYRDDAKRLARTAGAKGDTAGMRDWSRQAAAWTRTIVEQKNIDAEDTRHGL